MRRQSLIKKETRGPPTPVPGVAVAGLLYESKYATRARRLILMRRSLDRDGGGKRLLACPGYKYQALRTSRPAGVGALEVWREDPGRAGLERA